MHLICRVYTICGAVQGQSCRLGQHRNRVEGGDTTLARIRLFITEPSFVTLLPIYLNCRPLLKQSSHSFLARI